MKMPPANRMGFCNTSRVSDFGWKDLEGEGTLMLLRSPEEWPTLDSDVPIKGPGCQYFNGRNAHHAAHFNGGMPREDVDPVESSLELSNKACPLPQLCDENLGCSRVEVEGWIREVLQEAETQYIFAAQDDEVLLMQQQQQQQHNSIISLARSCTGTVDTGEHHGAIAAHDHAAYSPLPDVGSPQMEALPWQPGHSENFGTEEEEDPFIAVSTSPWLYAEEVPHEDTMRGKPCFMEGDEDENTSTASAANYQQFLDATPSSEEVSDDPSVATSSCGTVCCETYPSSAGIGSLQGPEVPPNLQQQSNRSQEVVPEHVIYNSGEKATNSYEHSCNRNLLLLQDAAAAAAHIVDRHSEVVQEKIQQGKSDQPATCNTSSTTPTPTPTPGRSNINSTSGTAAAAAATVAPRRRNTALGSRRSGQMQVRQKQNPMTSKCGHRRERLTRAVSLVDLRGLLVSCAEAVAANDAGTANRMLHEMWRHASPLGNGTQRLAYYFAQGLAARLSGTGSSSSLSLAGPAVSTLMLPPHLQQQNYEKPRRQAFHSVFNSSSSSSSAEPSSSSSSSSTRVGMLPPVAEYQDERVLRAYHTYVAVCPFLKLSHFFANEAILSAARGAKRIHIVDFNILYGLQWPCFLKALAEREEGPPELVRITGVDVNYIHAGVGAAGAGAGAGSSWRLEEARRRLREYAQVYGLKLEYRKVEGGGWERVTWEGLGLREGEVLAVNCINRLRHVMEEGVVVAGMMEDEEQQQQQQQGGSGGGGMLWCPREAALARIRKLNPAVFIEGVVNAAYNAPFFMSRFKEALFHYGSVFDALDSTVRQDLEERLVIERDIMGREIMNVVACEGVERRERPETYRRWQLRTQRVGFRLLPVDPAIKGAAQAIARGFYHKDYGVEDDEHGHWLLLGWKGRMLHGISCWRPVT